MINMCYVSRDEFINIVSKEEIVCFGAGKKFMTICNEYPQIVDRIICVADNNKSATQITILGKSIPIVSYDDEALLSKKYIGIISSSAYADEIIKKLDSIELFDGMRTYVPFAFKIDLDDEIVLEERKPIIPKIIHYCWFGENPIPPQFQENIESWRKHCPDYEIICWNESNYDYKKNKYMYEAYQAKKWGFVPDYARLDIINHYGGIYLDTDVEMIKSFDELLGYKMFCGFESKEYVALGLGFGGIKNNFILQEMMSQYESLNFINEDGSLNMIASPVYQTEVLERHGLKRDGSFQEIDGCTIFPKEYFAPSDGVDFSPLDCTRAFSIHQYAATWIDENARKKKERNIESARYVKNRMLLFNSNNK